MPYNTNRLRIRMTKYSRFDMIMLYLTWVWVYYSLNLGYFQIFKKSTSIYICNTGFGLVYRTKIFSLKNILPPKSLHAFSYVWSKTTLRRQFSTISYEIELQGKLSNKTFHFYCSKIWKFLFESFSRHSV